MTVIVRRNLGTYPPTIERRLVDVLVVAEHRGQVEFEACFTLQRVREQRSEVSRVGQERAQPAGAVGMGHCWVK